MEHKSGKVHLRIQPCAKVNGALVAISVRCAHPDWFALHKLQREKRTSDPQYANGSPCIQLCYAMYKKVHLELFENPAAAGKYQVGGLKCALAGNDFVITFNTKANLSYVKRAAAKVLMLMVPSAVAKYYWISAENLGVHYGKATKDTLEGEFAAAVTHMNKSLEQVRIYVSGVKAAVDKAKKDRNTGAAVVVNEVKMVADYIADCCPTLENMKGGIEHKYTARPLDPDLCTVINGKGDTVALALTCDYLFYCMNIRCDVIGNQIVIWGPKLASQVAKYADHRRIEGWCAKIYKMGDNITCILPHYMLSRQVVPALDDLGQIGPKLDLVLLISKCLGAAKA